MNQITERPTFDDLMEIACRMSQEIQETCDAARESETPLVGAEALLDEFNRLYAASLG